MVGSDKERPKGRVGSGSDNARGSPILNSERHGLYVFSLKTCMKLCQNILSRKLNSLPNPTHLKYVVVVKTG